MSHLEQEIVVGPRMVDICALVDACEKEPQINCPLFHEFPPGLYVRTIFMPKGAYVVSRVHREQHPYFITKGAVEVWTEAEGKKLFVAPFPGMTEPGTCRLLHILEDCYWTTVHPNPGNVKDPEKLMDILTEDPRVVYRKELESTATKVLGV